MRGKSTPRYSVEEFEKGITSAPAQHPLTCRTCGTLQPRANFWRNFDNPDPDRPYLLDCKECMGTPKPKDPEYHRFLEYIHRLESNGIDDELQKLHDLKARLTERAHWLTAYKQAQEK